jgi:hypothetical protein
MAAPDIDDIELQGCRSLFIGTRRRLQFILGHLEIARLRRGRHGSEAIEASPMYAERSTILHDPGRDLTQAITERDPIADTEARG